MPSSASAVHSGSGGGPAVSRQSSPFQFLVGNHYDASAATQIIPNDSWTPVDFPRAVIQSGFSTTPTRAGAAAYTVTNSATLTVAGPSTIEVTAGSVVNLLTPSTLNARWLTVYDITNDTYQVVRYTGLSAGTGTGGADQITGVTKGNYNLGSSSFQVRQAYPFFQDGEVGTSDSSPFELFQSVVTVAWQSNATGIRRLRLQSLFGFGPALLPGPVYYAQDLVGANTPAGPSGDPPACQMQVMSGQPALPKTIANVSWQYAEVYQSSGGNLNLIRHGLPAAPIAMNAWFPASY